MAARSCPYDNEVSKDAAVSNNNARIFILI